MGGARGAVLRRGGDVHHCGVATHHAHVRVGLGWRWRDESPLVRCISHVGVLAALVCDALVVWCAVDGDVCEEGRRVCVVELVSMKHLDLHVIWALRICCNLQGSGVFIARTWQVVARSKTRLRPLPVKAGRRCSLQRRCTVKVGCDSWCALGSSGESCVMQQ